MVPIALERTLFRSPLARTSRQCICRSRQLFGICWEIGAFGMVSLSKCGYLRDITERVGRRQGTVSHPKSDRIGCQEVQCKNADSAKATWKYRPLVSAAWG